MGRKTPSLNRREFLKVSAVLGAILLLVFILANILRLIKTNPDTVNSFEVLTPNPTEVGYPPPMWGPTADPTVVTLMKEAEETQFYQPPTPTIPPFPTLLPTPVVTPIPLADFPVIPGLQDGTFTIVYRQENVLWAVDSDGQNERLLLDIDTKLPLFLVSGQFSPSPDGKQLALVLSNLAKPSQKGGPRRQFDIYLYDLDSGYLRLLIQDGVEPVWSPDGAQIAYRGSDSGLWVLDLASGGTRSIYAVDRENNHHVTWINWSPDTQHLVFVDEVFQQSTVLVKVKSDGTQMMELVTPETGYFLRSPRWSTDGEKIAYVSLVGEKSASDYFDNLWLVNPDGTGRLQITFDMGVSVPFWSPDSPWIAFSGTKFYEEPKPYTDLWILNVTEGKLKRLTSNSIEGVNDLLKGWSPDGSQIIFLKQIYLPEDSTVNLMSLSSGAQTLLTKVTRDFQVLP